jgi:hypothetical protein
MSHKHDINCLEAAGPGKVRCKITGESARPPKRGFKPGDKIKVTAKFLQSTGQITGSDAHGRWTVVPHPGCGMCSSGDFVAVDEKSAYDQTQQRHFAASNIMHASKPDYSGL